MVPHPNPHSSSSYLDSDPPSPYMGVGTCSFEPISTPYVPSSSSNPNSTMAGTNAGTNIGANANQPFVTCMEGLNLMI